MECSWLTLLCYHNNVVVSIFIYHILSLLIWSFVLRLVNMFPHYFSLFCWSFLCHLVWLEFLLYQLQNDSNIWHSIFRWTDQMYQAHSETVFTDSKFWLPFVILISGCSLLSDVAAGFCLLDIWLFISFHLMSFCSSFNYFHMKYFSTSILVLHEVLFWVLHISRVVQYFSFRFRIMSSGLTHVVYVLEFPPFKAE